jgi:hypothetical protein
MRTIFNADALSSLSPGANFEMLYDEYENLVWQSPDLSIPTKEEMEAEKVRLQQIEIDKQYQGQRAGEYPPIYEQLDMIWHGMNEDETKRIEPFYSVIKKVKDNFPKI